MRALLAILAVLAVAAVTGCGSDDEAPLSEDRLRISTGSPGGVYAPYGEGLAELVNERLPRLRASVIETDASIENLENLAAGTAEVAFAQADSASNALRGTEQFKRPVRIRALARLYEDALHLVVRDGSDVHGRADLGRPGIRVSVGARRSGTKLVAEQVLALRPAVAPEREELGLDDSIAAFKAGRIDAFFFSGGVPVRAIEQLAKDVPIRLVDLGDEAEQLRGESELYTKIPIPRSAYGDGIAAATIGVPNLLVVREDFDEETAYRVTRLLFAGRDELVDEVEQAARLNPTSALGVYPLTLHPGARRYYKESAG